MRDYFSREIIERMKVLSIDLGKARAGLAESFGTLAEPLEVVSREKVLDRVMELIAKFKVNYIIIGLPSGEMEQEVKRFAERLGLEIQTHNLSIQIELVDETLTSQQAQLIKRYRPQAKRRLPDDAIAAALILEEWIERHVVNSGKKSEFAGLPRME